MKAISQPWSAIRCFFQEKKLSFDIWMPLLISGILLFIFSLDHVIALRKFLLVLGFLIAFKSFWKAMLEKPQPLVTVVTIFLILQVWMVVISLLIAKQPADSLAEWVGQWLPALMTFAIGIGLAHSLMQSKLKEARVAIVMLIVIPVTLYQCVNAIDVIRDMILEGKFLTQQPGISDHKANIGYLIALLEPILIADMLSRLIKGNRLIPVPGWVTGAILVLALFSLITASSRNGIIIMLMAFVLGSRLMISEIRKVYSQKKIIGFILATLILTFLFAFASYKSDPRWQNFSETVPIAWDIDRDLLWLNGDDASSAPLTPSGRKVDISAYSRIAWAHEGWRMLMDHPWGLEIARDTFHKLELAKYGHAGMAHSHNSWIDFGLEVGLIGLVFWGSILILLARFGLQVWKKQNNPLGVALAILVIMFAVRGLLDSIFRDHEIEQFMLVC
jgi:O-antigen ligase